MFEQFPALLVTKLYIPRVRAAYVSRSALLAALDAAVERRLILIAAAAGSGKTSLLAEWSGQRVDEVCWLSLDEGDNDPTRLLSYLVAAVQTRHLTIGRELLAALQSPQPPPPITALHSLINQLAALQSRLIVVLDDVHVLENPAVHNLLTFLLDHLPQQITLVMLTRSDPPLPLARLRARHELLELRAADLRFSAAEAERLLNDRMGLSLSREAISALEARTEGWIAGLQLAALALQNLQDKAAFVRSFTGSHRFVLDYLIEEVLSRQPEAVRRFMLYTSILTRLNGALCSAVVSDEQGHAMLELLDRNNLFLIPLDHARQWYRYHHLFADLLQARLHAEQPHMLKTLYQRAAQWHDTHNLPEEAIAYALAAHDYEYAAHLMTQPTTSAMRRGEVNTLLAWYRAFPPEFVTQQPRLCLQFGMAFALNGRWDEAETLLAHVQQAAEVLPLGESLILAYLIASQRYDAPRLAALAQAAAQVETPDRTTKVALGLLLSVNGDLRAACQWMREAQQDSEREGDHALALTALSHQCLLNVFLGNLRLAHDQSQQALQVLHDVGVSGSPIESFAHVSLGRIFIEWGEYEQANHYLTQAVQLGARTGFVTGMLSSATLMLAEVKQARGDEQGAREAVQAAVAHAERHDPPPEVQWLKVYAARVALMQGKTADAAEWLQAAQSQTLINSLFYPNSVRHVTQARLLLAQRKTNEALALLTKLVGEPHDLLTIEALNLLAIGRQAGGDHVHALLTVEQALALAATENRVRAFVDLGAPMSKLLTRFCEAHPEHAFARRVLAQFPSQVDLPETLGARELEVLRLIVAGRSNEEIARELTLALSTVKWYINELYGKLHVKTRSQAIARAHEWRLLQ